jgi:O-6-methylguanine DNA methyltransferase
MTTLDTARFTSPIGDIVLFADGDHLVGLEFFHGAQRLDALRAQLHRRLGAFAERAAGDPAGAVTRLVRYFAGDRDALSDQPVRPHGTAFQRRVWRALCEIPAGETRSYGQLAASIGAPTASRAVGAANGSNPVSLFVPCHRVIASDGTLHGYGGGLDRKQWLLEHEGALLRTAGRKAQLALI